MADLFLANLTNEELCAVGEGTPLSEEQIREYLHAHPINAVMLHGIIFDGGTRRLDAPLLVGHTANPRYFYLAYHPTESPDDVILSGVDLAEILFEAMELAAYD